MSWISGVGLTPFGKHPGRSTLDLMSEAAALALAGCALKKPPDAAELRGQALPNFQMPESWASAAANGGSVQGGWLAFFDDPQLSQLASEALAYNADLQVASARVEQAAGYARLAAAGMYPAVNLLARGGGEMSGDNSGLQGVALSAGLVGYSAGLNGRRSLAIAIILIVALGTVIALVIDVDRPADGLIETSQQPLISLQQSIENFP